MKSASGGHFWTFGRFCVSIFTGFVSNRECHIVQFRHDRKAVHIKWPVVRRKPLHFVSFGPLCIAFGVMECGQGWSRRYRGFRVLWRGNRVAKLRIGAPVQPSAHRR